MADTAATPTGTVMSEIARFLKEEWPEVICIRGDWGVGKTYAWREALREAAKADAIGLKTYSYVSLFGVTTLDQLKFAIFENRTSGASIGRSADMETFGHSIDTAIKIFGVKTIEALAGKNGSDLVQSGAFLTVRNQIVCIDDIERKGKDLRTVDILGLVSMLVEERNCKVAIILNDEQLQDERDDFNRHHEKVVDHSYLYAPTAAEVARIAIPKPRGLAVDLVDRMTALNVTNIRVVRKIHRLLQQIEPLSAGRHAEVTRQMVSTLALLGWLHFGQTDESMKGLIDFALNKRGQVVPDEESKFTNEELRWDNFLDRYGYSGTDELDLVIFDGIRAGYFNNSQMDELSATLDVAARNREAFAKLESAWDLFRTSLDDNADLVVEGILGAFKQGIDAVSIANLDSTVRTFKELERPDEATEALEYYLKNRKGGSKAFDLSSFAFRHNVHDPDVIARLTEKALSDHILPTADEVLQQISASNSLSNPGLEVLSRLTVEEFADLFRRNAGTTLREFISTLNEVSGMRLQDNRYEPMTKNAWAAMEQLAGESRLNAVRFASFYGYAPSSKKKPEDGSSEQT